MDLARKDISNKLMIPRREKKQWNYNIWQKKNTSGINCSNYAKACVCYFYQFLIFY